MTYKEFESLVTYQKYLESDANRSGKEYSAWVADVLEKKHPVLLNIYLNKKNILFADKFFEFLERKWDSCVIDYNDKLTECNTEKVAVIKCISTTNQNLFIKNKFYIGYKSIYDENSPLYCVFGEDDNLRYILPNGSECGFGQFEILGCVDNK
jgi:hypothetical protein